MVYAIYEEFFPDVEKKLNRIAKKCMKHGNPFTYEVKGEEIREQVNQDHLDITEYFKFILVEVEGTAKIDDWECVAVIDIHEVGNIIRRINTEVEIPERFKTTENICEHCNSKRNRKSLFVIHNVHTEEWKQVGGDCLKLYTGGLNLEYVVAFIDGITELEEMNGKMGGAYSKPYYSVENVLAYAVEIIAKTGYFNSNSNCPTKRLVKHMAMADRGRKISHVNEELLNANLSIRFSSKDFNKEETIPYVEEIINYYSNIEDDSDFSHNIKVLLNLGYVQPKDFGFLSYLPEGYAKHIQKEIERAKQMEENHEHFGEVGKRYKDCEIQNIEIISSWETEWGVTCVYKITLVDGEILTWKTNKAVYTESDEEFDKITFTVKGHGEYKGVKQTEVTRCKVTTKKKLKKGA